MFLAKVSEKDMNNWLEKNKSERSSVLDVVPCLPDHCTAYFIANDEGRKAGLLLVTGTVSDYRYSNMLVLARMIPEEEKNLPRLIPNIMRSLRVDKLLVRSDDCHAMTIMAHFTFEHYHLLQIYEIENLVDAPVEKVQLVKTDKQTDYRKFTGKHDFDVFTADIFDEKLDYDIYEATSGRRKLGVVITQVSPTLNLTKIFPVIRQTARREKWGTAVTLKIADIIRADGATPALVIRPENEVAVNFVNYMRGTPVFDLVCIKPMFHIRPLCEEPEGEHE